MKSTSQRRRRELSSPPMDISSGKNNDLDDNNNNNNNTPQLVPPATTKASNKTKKRVVHHQEQKQRSNLTVLLEERSCSSINTTSTTSIGNINKSNNNNSNNNTTSHLSSTTILHHHHPPEEEEIMISTTPPKNNNLRNKDFEADCASGPTINTFNNPLSIGTNLIRSAPTTTTSRTATLRKSSHQLLVPKQQRITTISTSLNDNKELSPRQLSFPPVSSPPLVDSSSSFGAFRNGRRCISSKELGALAPSASQAPPPFTRTLHQRDILEAQMQQRLQETRQTNLSIDKSLDSLDSSTSSKTKKTQQQQQLKNKTRNKRRAEATRTVTNDLCDIVTDLFIAEAKLLKPSIYGIETSLHQRDQVFGDIYNFVSALPPRYALGVDTPSEVLLHMRLMAAARSDNNRAVVHLTKLNNNQVPASDVLSEDSLFLVTISSIDCQGLLEYITRLLATGGSRVLDADVMMSSDNIVLDRFIVQMKGRLRLDKFSQSIEAFLANNNNNNNNLEKYTTQKTQESTSINIGSSSHERKKYQQQHASKTTTTPPPRTLSSSQREVSGPLYFHAPEKVVQEVLSPQELQQEIDSAIPLSQVLSSASVIPMRRDEKLLSRKLRRGQSLPPVLMESWMTNDDHQIWVKSNDTTKPPPNEESPTKMEEKPIITTSRQQPDNDERKDRNNNNNPRPLVSREATNFLDPEERMKASSTEYTRVLSPSSSPHQLPPSEEHNVPLISFEELMLIETLEMGRVSTIYRAAWQKKSGIRETTTTRAALTDVQMVALKVATVHEKQGSSSHIDELQREADIAAVLKHPNVCDLVGIAVDAECFCLAYEFCEGGSVLSLLSETARYYEYLPIALDVANGMAYLHSRNVIHRDLKPSNVLLTRDHRAKISDFGMSVADRGQELTAETGTYRYMAPEVIRHESYTSNADVYSFGIFLWQLITREIPFGTMTPIQAAFSVAEGLRPDIPPRTPSRLRDIIVACWDQDAHKRPSFTYIAMALADYARMAFSPANVGAQTLQIANEMLATVEGNSTINVDFSTLRDCVVEDSNNSSSRGCLTNNSSHSFDIGLEI